MPDIAEILSIATETGGILKTSTEIVDSIKNISGGKRPDAVEAEKLILSLYKQLNEAQVNQMAIQTALLKVQSELEKMDRFEQEAARYTLAETDMGGRVYTLKPNDPMGEPPHEICATCHDQQIKSILQPAPDAFNTLACFRCGTRVLKGDNRQKVRTGPVSYGKWDDFP